MLFTILLMVHTSCSVGEEVSPAAVEPAIGFGIGDIAQTKVEYTEGESDARLSAEFEPEELIGIYAFYNNFFYYYTEYAGYAESVIFHNQWLKIDKVDVTKAAYEPQLSWTFSTLYGDSPHTLDCVAYYPYAANYNPRYANLVHSYSTEDSNGGAATLEYYYVGYMGGVSDNATEVVNANVDFMTAHVRYDSYTDSADAAGFRDYIISNPTIALSFTRQLASLDLQVTKPLTHNEKIFVNELQVIFDAPAKFEQKIDETKAVAWSDVRRELSYTVDCNDKELIKNTWDDTPVDDVAKQDVENLLGVDNMLFFPPDTYIRKLVFTITIGEGDAATQQRYVWHPHVATFVRNKHYTLTLELDPERDN